MKEFNIVTVDTKNIEEYGFFCVRNKNHPGYVSKIAWLQKRFAEGLRIKLIITADGKKSGFLEYIPGEYTWRVIDAPNYIVIHCLWVNSRKFPHDGMASALIKECTANARLMGKMGVAVVTSDGTWMAGRAVYQKNGFEIADQTEPHYQLLVKKLTSGQSPAFPKNWDERSQKYHGLQLIYTNQCPYIGKAIAELPPVADRYGVNLKLVEYNNAAAARKNMPSPYGVMNLLYNGKLLADHPISATRFKNILERDLKLIMETTV